MSRSQIPEGVDVSKLKNNINTQFIEWVEQVGILNKERVLEICTFLLNLSICQNYFAVFKVLSEEFPSIIPENLTLSKIRDFRIVYEKIYGFFILVVLKYYKQQKLNQNDTDKKIDEDKGYSKLFQSFFIVNFLPENEDLDVLFDYIGKSSVPNRLLPQLDFDPEFKKILDDEAIKELYDTSFITDWLDSKPFKKRKYEIKLPIAKEILKLRAKPYKRLFEIDPDLNISKFNYKQILYFGNYFFASNEHFKDIIRLFKQYYTKRIPTKAIEISKVLDAFLIFSKIIKRKTYEKIRLSKLKTNLRKELDRDTVNQFIKLFFFTKSRKTLQLENTKNSVSIIFKVYHDFLCSAGYIYSGVVHTGIFSIWRALIKYFESLHKDEVFKKLKGALLENWCYEKATALGYNSKKIILTNPLVEPSDDYYKMLKQIEDFPDEHLSLDCEFYGDYSKYDFFEIDLAIKIPKYLIIIECKSYGIPFSEDARFISWMDNFRRNVHLTIMIGNHIIENLKNDNIQHKFFEDTQKFIPIIVQTEGLFPDYGIIQFSHLERFLKDLKEHIRNDTVEEFLKNPWKLEEDLNDH